MKENRIEQAILSARDERADGFNARVTVKSEKIIIDTQVSRDPRRRNDGGEYDFWLEVWPDEDGQTLMQEACSCNFWQPDKLPEVLTTTYTDVVVLVRKLAAENGVPVVE